MLKKQLISLEVTERDRERNNHVMSLNSIAATISVHCIKYLKRMCLHLSLSVSKQHSIVTEAKYKIFSNFIRYFYRREDSAAYDTQNRLINKIKNKGEIDETFLKL